MPDKSLPSIEDRVYKVLVKYDMRIEAEGALTAIMEIMRELIPDERSEGSHKGHSVYDEFCQTCNDGMAEEEWILYWNYKYNECIAEMKRRLE